MIEALTVSKSGQWDCDITYYCFFTDLCKCLTLLNVTGDGEQKQLLFLVIVMSNYFTKLFQQINANVGSKCNVNVM